MLFECHGHIILDGVSYTDSVERHRSGLDEIFVKNNLKICAESGVKFYRDGGDKHGVSVFAKKAAGMFDIDYRTPSYIIHKKGYYGSMFGRAFESMLEFRALVAEAKDADADFIKITASGLLDFANGGSVTGAALTSEELFDMIGIAHGEGFSVMVHANGADNIIRAAEAGADSIEHGFYMDSRALHVMTQTGAVWVPTCVTVSNLIGAGLYNDEVLRSILQKHEAALIEASMIGVPVACGSDAGASFVPQGSGTLDELSVLNSLGIDPQQGNRRIEEVFRRKC